ncbi:MAG: DUF4157 domain-containing protein [Nitrospira sp.]
MKSGRLTLDPTAFSVDRGADKFGWSFARGSGVGKSVDQQLLGTDLPFSTRREAEQRFNHSFAHVRVHDDRDGGMVALGLGARAVTVGHHIYAAPGALQADRRGLLMHELSHVVAQDPALGTYAGIVPQDHPAERAARQAESGQHVTISHAPIGIYRSPMTRDHFENEMRLFGVRKIFTATFEQQRERLNYFGAGARPGDLLTKAAWKAWSPGDDSAVYDWIVAAFSGFARTFGGVPKVTEIGFFPVDYELAADGTLAPKRNVAADFGGGRMAIYRTAVDQAGNFLIPAGRSTDGVRAQLNPSTEAQGVTGAITHELGHGLVETALTPQGKNPAPDPQFMRDYRLAAGWTGGAKPELFDAGAAEVQTALEGGQTPPAKYKITEANWNEPTWVEQPMTLYMTTHPSEDLPEAVAAYVNTPELLRQRSPRRFQFLDTHRAVLAPFLQLHFSKLRLRLTDQELHRIIKPTPEPWLQPVPAPAPPTGSGGRRGPLIEFRF